MHFLWHFLLGIHSCSMHKRSTSESVPGFFGSALCRVSGPCHSIEDNGGSSWPLACLPMFDGDTMLSGRVQY
ncbi:hypothetical protein EDB84DRAFT_1491404 [Lactarius hengduanensis]|nr:hypothetical protein EDB84DRAFT_1491404 [Lactarius hengduanensis]